MARQLTANIAGALANSRRFSAELRIVDHLFDVTQPIGPIAEIFARDRSGDPLRSLTERFEAAGTCRIERASLQTAPSLPPALLLTVPLLAALLLATLLLARLSLRTLPRIS
jgi:hypothetical protein